MKWLVGIVLLLAAVVGVLIAIHQINHVDARAKAEQIRKTLGPVNSQAEFSRIAADNGLKCETTPIPEQPDGTQVLCWWFETKQPYDLIGQFDFILSGIRAIGTFTGGIKNDAYDVQDVYTGP